MAEPSADGVDVHAGEHQVAGRRVPDHMRGYRSACQFRRPGRTTLGEPIDPEAGIWLSEPADEDSVVGRATADLASQSPFCFRPQRTLARLAALSVQGGEIMPAVPTPDLQIPHLQLRRLGDTRSGIVEEEQKRVFALASRSLAVRHASMACISALVSHPTGGGMDFFDAIDRMWPHHST